jgi:hypothetical protein
MYSSPYIFFHGPVGHMWHDRTDPALQNFHTLNDAPSDLLPSLTVNVSRPDALMTWLETNNAALITDLCVFVDATSHSTVFWPPPPCDPQPWCRLFNKLQREATNIRRLSINWDAEGPWFTSPPWDINCILDDPYHPGLGRSVVFIRALAQLKVKESVEIGGFYAKHWPRYLEEKMGLKPVTEKNVLGSFWGKALRNYQDGTEQLNPWTDT